MYPYFACRKFCAPSPKLSYRCRCLYCQNVPYRCLPLNRMFRFAEMLGKVAVRVSGLVSLRCPAPPSLAGARLASPTAAVSVCPLHPPSAARTNAADEVRLRTKSNSASADWSPCGARLPRIRFFPVPRKIRLVELHFLALRTKRLRPLMTVERLFP